MTNISFYFQHGSSISVEQEGRYVVIELERLTRRRYYSVLDDTIENASEVIRRALNILKTHYGIDVVFDVCVFPGCTHYNQLKTQPIMSMIRSLIRARKYIILDHHYAHAACAAYQSPYNKGIIISYDGAGNDGYFNIYRYNGIITPLCRLQVQSFGKCYRAISFIIRDINKVSNGKCKPLVGYAGKLMGLVAYGKVREEWVEGFENFYETRDITYLSKITGLSHITEEQFVTNINTQTSFTEYEGPLSYDLAATNQYVFEKKFFQCIEPWIEGNEPIHITGGCALNVLTNEKVRRQYGNRVFVPPNPDDSGISLGQLFIANRPSQPVNATYAGLPILDIHMRDSLVETYQVEELDIRYVAELLTQGCIIGVLRGNSEIGPRALGNRSILCDPSYPGMKDRLNTIKNREWFRPFATVVRREDVELFFNFNYDSPFMSFSPGIKSGCEQVYPSIAHVDGTSRVQTVDECQNYFLYTLLGYIENPLINTSLNINGEPMVCTIEQGLNILDTTTMDYLIVDDIIIKSK